MSLASMMLAGLPIRDADVLELARLLREVGFDDTAERLEDAYDVERKVLALTIAECEQVLRALAVCPEGLAELRGTLLLEHEGRVARDSSERRGVLSGPRYTSRRSSSSALTDPGHRAGWSGKEEAIPRTLSLLYPNGKTELWLTEQLFDVGDKITRNGQTWVVTSLGNFNRDGKALAVTVRPYGESLPNGA